MRLPCKHLIRVRLPAAALPMKGIVMTLEEAIAYIKILENKINELESKLHDGSYLTAVIDKHRNRNGLPPLG